MSIKRQHIGYNLKHITIAIFIAMGIIIFVSCSTDEVNAIIEKPIENVAVQFNTNIEKETPTRATTLDDAVLKSQGFGILAHYTQSSAWSEVATRGAPNFMYNQRIVWNTPNTSWSYSPVKYWPNNSGHKVTFFAYAPYESNPATGGTKGIKLPANTEEGTPSINFSINSSIANQVDLVYASAKDKNKELVDFQFKHALSRIGFSAKTAAAYSEEIKVTNISVSGRVYPSATFTFSDQFNDGSWGSHATTVNAGITYTPSNIALNTNPQQINAANQYIMIIPQNFAGTNKVTIGTTYTIDGVLPGITSSEDINFNFEQGKAYNITLNISVSKVEIYITVANWNVVQAALFMGRGFNVEVDEAGIVTVKNTVKAYAPHDVKLKTKTGFSFVGGGTEKVFSNIVANASQSYQLTPVPTAGQSYLEVYYNNKLVKTFTK